MFECTKEVALKDFVQFGTLLIPIQVQIESFDVMRAPFLGTTRILPWARLLIVILVDLAHFEPN